MKSSKSNEDSEEEKEDNEKMPVDDIEKAKESRRKIRRKEIYSPHVRASAKSPNI